MLISAIMPTRNRPRWVVNALECYHAQTWPREDRELVIVDDEDAPSFSTPPEVHGIHYHRMRQRLTVGAKRNIACSRATGSIVIHWDDDDWSAPQRMEDQINRLLSSNVLLTGYRSMIFESAETGERWKFTGHAHLALGTSLCYRRELWERTPFQARTLERQAGEDGAFVMHTPSLITVDAGNMMIASIHSNNTSVRKIDQGLREWQKLES